jgi:uncharacterized coiled-coil protein SlyX
MATVTETLAQQSQIMGILNRKIAAQGTVIASLQQAMSELSSRPRSVLEEIDAYPGRRMETMLTGEITFTLNDEGAVGAPILIQVNQDGPFVMTHYPMAIWRPSAPTNATNLGRWRPVTSFPLPTQQVTTDIIDIMWELQDGGSMRNMQNAPRGPGLSRPDNFIPCAVPTVFSPNSAIKFIPTYNAITWDSENPPTQGTLHVDLIGYRIVNL